MTGSCPDGRDCRLPRMSRVSIALLSLALACALLICGVAGAADYGEDSGIDNITSLNCSTWSALLSNNVSTVTCNINVTSGVLNLSNAMIRMGGGYSISVQSGATMNIIGGSTITRRDSGYYYFNYESGSRGSMSASVIEYSDRLYIATTNNITITGCTVRNNRNHGIHLSPTSGYVNITNCMINNTVYHHDIFIESSQDNILRSNSLNNNSRDYSLYVTGDYDQDIDTSNTVNGGRVYYNHGDSGKITGDANIGHVTIANCNNLWFAGCTIHNGDGVRIVGSSSSGISGSTIENNARQGVCFTDSSNNFINDSQILDNNQQGILSDGSSSYNGVIGNSIINNSVGLSLIGEGYNNLTDNNILDNRGNGIVIGTYGVHSSEYNVLHNNTIRLNNGSGITFQANYNNLTNNIISENVDLAFEFPSATAMCYCNYIWRSNRANGEEINYYYNENGVTVSSKTLTAYNVSDVGKITLINCYNFDIQDNTLSNNIHKPGSGIFLWNSYENDLTGNTISNNYDGIRLYNSSNNNFTDLQTIYPSDQHGAMLGTGSNHNIITDSSLAARNQQGMQISSSNHTTLANILISSVDQPGLATASAHHIDITNATIVATESDGVHLSTSDNVIITESDITANNIGVDCADSDHTEIANTTIRSEDGICMTESHWGNLTDNTIAATLRGIFLTTSRNHNVTTNKIADYAITGILLEEYSTNNLMIGNDLTRNGAEFDIRLTDSNDCVIGPNSTVTADYTYYLTDDTRLATLDTVFNKTKVGYGDDKSNLILMWRIDVLCWDNYHREAMWSNLTVQYSDFSDANGSLCWKGEISAKADDDSGLQSGRLSGNPFDYWGPPRSGDNWLPIIEYKQNASGKTTYQPMNCTAINGWDVLQKIYDRTYQNVTTTIAEPGVTILVDSGYTPNSRCYYCHDDKLTFANTEHWTNYEVNVTDMTDPYTPGRCIDCHDEADSLKVPHGNRSGKDLLYQQSPQLCYSGRTGGLDCHSTDAAQGLDQEREFNQTTHHPLGDGNLSCKACHDNHGTEYPADLLKEYETTTSGEYNSSHYALCLVCHLEEKIVAKMSDEDDDHLKNYVNQTNFQDEYFSWSPGFNNGTPALQNIHSPQTETGFHHPAYNCYSCHNPHGGNNPAMTRPSIDYIYITNLTPPGAEYEFGDWENQTILDHTNWNNPTMNQAGGLDKPSNPDCSGCHNTCNLQNGYFNYRTYFDYKPAGGAGCLECHDNSRSDAIRPIVNLSAVKLAMHQNLSWWALEGVNANLPGTDKNFAEWLTARGYADTNLDRNNSICWACHSTNGTPPAPEFHPDRALNPYKCPKCHGPEDGQPPHTKGVVKAIDNHGPTTKGKESIFIQTDVGKNGSCGDCHAASRLSDDDIGSLEVWKWGTGSDGYSNNWITYAGRTTMGDVSHYGLNKSQGQGRIANPLFDTYNCLYCHCNGTAGAIWGNAPNVTDNMYGADTSNLSECYTYCHVLPDYLYNITEDNIPHFHNKSLYAGGGFDCVVCHDIDSNYGVLSRIDADAIATGIHGNVANYTTTNSPECDPRSKPCWGCHNSDGTQPDGMGDRNGIYMPQQKPWSCEDCHARSDEWNASTNYGETWTSSSYPPNRLPPWIYAHYPNGTTLKTNMSHGRCVDCHNNSIDQSHADTYGAQLTNTLASNVSHYGTLTHLISPTKNCGVCHNNRTAGLIWGDAPQNEHGNFTDELNPEDGCFVCHTNDNHTPVDFHAENLLGGLGGPDCLKCHGDEGFAKNKRINESVFGAAMHWNTNNMSGVHDLNQSCWVCHFEDGLDVDMHSTRKDPPYLCYDCHNKEGAPFKNVSAAPNVYNHFMHGTNISAYWDSPTDSDSCMGCHNQSEMMYSFIENDTYHTTFSIVSHYGNNRTDIANLFKEGNNTEYCSYCHVNESTPFMQVTNDRNIRHAGGQNCNACHGEGRLHNETLTRVQTSGNCTDCHALYGANKTGTVYEINVTAMNRGVHEHVNENMTGIAGSEVGDANNAKCWGCHVPGGAYPEDGHRDTFNNDAYLCYECHNGTCAYQNVSTATAVYNHFKGGINITANTNHTIAPTNSSSCGFGCHNLSTMKVPGFDAGGNASYRVNMSQASHYPWNRADIKVNSNLSDCAWCHRNPTNEFIGIFAHAGYPNYTANIPHATKTPACIVPECHDRGRIHDRPLKIPTFEWADECGNCHFGLNDSDAYVNETMFNASVHGSVNCTKCHVNEGVHHPIEEFTWKWCECCHAYQSDPLNESDRHNITPDPANYSVNSVNVLSITNCTKCHDKTAYDSSKQNFNSGTEHQCRYCHSYPDDW
ncbi:MAG: hypothetical protein C4B59_04635 [Candidatus Methanogaster sp.]|uniref:Uncharacterized protein n=1 Tax=Candidatus Methanogaster sp. TaxID=3386292 RepID=A0AC61L488_9EURY|nr:MAG: hypothetical protein C4B59_04635 [ANME-2 cluster archaeon]